MSKKSKKVLILTLVALSASFVLGFVVLSTNSSPSDGDSDTSNSATSDSSSFTSNPPASSDSSTNEKAAIIEKNESSSAPTNTNGRQNITPVIVYAGVFGDNLEVSAYAPVVETSGKCTANITNSATGKITAKKSLATPSASTTDCNLLVVPVSQLGSGNYSVVVNYSSDESEGASSATEVNIP